MPLLPPARALFTRNGLVDGDRSEVRDVDAMYEWIEDQRMSAEAGGRVFAHMIAVRGVPDHGHAAQAVGG